MLAKWAARWGVSAEALADLRQIFICQATEAEAGRYSNEASVQAAVRLEASRLGVTLWRNNVGAYIDERGNHIRYGLANDSKRVNRGIKSSDLIGIKPGGQFVAREVKRPGWKFSGTERERAQLRFLQLVAALGGDAAFTDRVGSIYV